MTKKMPDDISGTNEWRRGWKVLVASFFGVGSAWHTLMIVSGLFIIPMQTEFGWSRTAVAFGPLASMLSIIFYLPAGMLIDRIGARPVAIAGMCLMAIGLVALSATPASIPVFYAIIVVIAVGGAGCNAIAFSRGIASWFKDSFGTAVGIMTLGISAMSALAFPVLGAVIESLGWRAGSLTLAGLILFVGLPVVLLWFRTREATTQTTKTVPNMVPGYTLGETLRDPRFWLLTLSFGMAGVPIGAFVVHLQPLLVASGFAVVVAAMLGSIFVTSVGIGRVLVGALLDRANPVYVTMGTMLLSAAGALLLNQISAGILSPVVIMAVILVGLSQGAESDFLAFFSRRVFGMRSYGRIVGIMSMAAGGGMAIGGFAFSILYDTLGGYREAVFLAALCYLVAALLMLTVKVPRTMPSAVADVPS